jgi:GNAT superfamily N-acetyltransferase
MEQLADNFQQNFRRWAGNIDIPGMLAVHRSCRQADSVDRYSVAYRVPNMSVEDYTNDVALSLADGTDKNILIAEVDGVMVGHSRLEWWNEWDSERQAERVAYLIRGWVIPEYRRKGIGSHFLEWAEARARDMDSVKAIQGELAANATDGEGDANQFLLDAGYQIRFLSPELSNEDFSSLPTPCTPNGFDILPLHPADHFAVAEALVLANAPATMTESQLKDWLATEVPGFVDFTSNCDHNLSRIAWKNGEVAGLYLCRRKEDVGDVANVAVIPKYRMRGLSRSLMFHCLHAMKVHGVTKALVFTGIGADRNAPPEGPYKMYLGFGFRLMTFHNRYRKPM